MIVLHRAFTVKKGRIREPLELLRELGARYPPVHGHRVCTTVFGSVDQPITEDEYESLVEHQRTWETLRECAEFAALQKG